MSDPHSLLIRLQPRLNFMKDLMPKLAVEICLCDKHFLYSDMLYFYPIHVIRCISVTYLQPI